MEPQWLHLNTTRASCCESCHVYDLGSYRGGSRNFWLRRGLNFGSERLVERFCGKLLLTETTTCFLVWKPVAVGAGIGSLRNDEGDGNDNGKKAISLDKLNNFARAWPFFVHFSAVVTRRRKTAKFHVLSRTGTKDNFLFLFLNFDAVL